MSEEDGSDHRLPPPPPAAMQPVLFVAVSTANCPLQKGGGGGEDVLELSQGQHAHITEDLDDVWYRGYIPSAGGGLQEPGLIAKTSVVKLDELLRLTQRSSLDSSFGGGGGGPGRGGGLYREDSQSQGPASEGTWQNFFDLRELLERGNLNADRWTSFLEREEVHNVADLEEVLADDEFYDKVLKRETKRAEVSKFERLRETAKEKQGLERWVKAAGLKPAEWMKLLSDQGITSQATLLSKSAEQTLKALRVGRPGMSAEEEEALRRLLRARLAGEEGERSEVDCLRGCGARVRADRVRRHNCVRDLRREVDARLRMFNVGQLERDVAQIKREFVEDRALTDAARLSAIAPPFNDRHPLSSIVTLDPNGDLPPSIITGNSGGSSSNNKGRKANYWLAKSGYSGAAFTYEFPTTVMVKEVLLRNTNDAGRYGWGTKEFSLLVTRDSQTYREVYNGELPNPIGVKQKNIPVVCIPELNVKAKAVRFDIKSHYGEYGPGLHYFKVKYEILS